MSNKAWKILSSKTLHEDKYNKVVLEKVELPNGQIIEKYPQLISPEVSMVFAVTKEEKVVMIREYRHAARKVMLGLPAGLNLDRKPPEKLARRELLEETGYTAPRFEKIGQFRQHSTKLSKVDHFYLARDATLKSAQTLDDTEDIEVVLIPLKRIKSLINLGKIEDSSTVAGILIALEKLGVKN